MRVTVHVKTRSKQEAVEVATDGSLLVSVNAAPVDGQANARVIALLARHYRVPKSSIRLVSGRRARIKIIELPS
jgi:uncharacterized protein